MPERIKIAVIGLNFGRVIVNELLREPAAGLFELALLCDKSQDAFECAKRDFGLPITADIDDVLADSSIRAVALMTPPGGRAGLIRRIIRSGRHVMTTKPFERDSAAAAEVLKEAAQLGMAVHLNSPAVVPSPVLGQIGKWRAQYDLGIPVGIRGDEWAFKPRPADGSWYDDPAKCPVAPIYRVGIYVINDLIELFGEVDKVSVFASRLITGRPTPDNAQLSLLFKNGAIGNIFVSFCVKDGLDHRHSLTANFEKGTIYVNAGPPVSTTDPESATDLCLVSDSGKRWAPVGERVVLRAAHGYAWQAFYDAIHGRDAANDRYRDRIVWGVRVVEAMARAEMSGKTETVG